ncbi:uncharacterized protein LOC115783543 [Archocentrus centrarchus]|uniref:uncharacterized protein LOC115783543 n=1 Tax=Archocentrus centrarchus TaxID=63155 RepID=UPI0011E9FAAB|nr:uncharacterized protein LOC115783543 [Archocentrus centrarchus]
MDIPHLNGQQRTYEFDYIYLRLSFPSFYNSYKKSCCKLYPGGCYKLLDSSGYTCELLKGRVTKTEKDGWIEFRISNVQFVDGGFYRCVVLGTPNQIYRDYYVELSEVSHHFSQSQPPITGTITAPGTSITLPDSTGPAVAEDHSYSNRVSWSFGLPLVVIVSITVMMFITLVTGIVCCRVRAKCKQSDKYGKTHCESLKQEASEMGGIVYTVVDFRALQKPEEVYANVRLHKARAGATDIEHAGTVEYSTLAIQP